jgi:hypothetical protein
MTTAMSATGLPQLFPTELVLRVLGTVTSKPYQNASP